MRFKSWLTTNLIALLLLPGVANARSIKLLEATIDDIHASLMSGQITCREIVEFYLERIEAYDKAGPKFNAVQYINPLALQEADGLDSQLESSGLIGSLHCVPVLLKDQVETRDMPTTYGSVLFKEFVPNRDATIVVKMKKAGAIVLAKTNMGEFASGYVGSAFGIIRNAYDPSRSPSGSSGGTGTGISANLGMVGIGEDTGGSISGPASVNSLVGLRPTVPLVSRYGMMPANPSSDTLGPITRTVKDSATLLDVLVGYDPNDTLTAYSVGRIPESYTAFLEKDGLSGARIGVVREPMDPRTDLTSDDHKKVLFVIDRALTDMESLGAEVVDPVTVQGIDLVSKIYVKNKYETEEAMDKYLAQHPNIRFKSLREILLSGKVTPWRAPELMDLVGRSTKGKGYFEVILAREELRRRVLNVMASNGLDALVYATFDHQPRVIKSDVLTNPSGDDDCGLGNNRQLSPVIGFPAVTVPAGFTTEDLPVGIEFLGRPFTEGLLLRLAYGYEQGTQWRKPPAQRCLL